MRETAQAKAAALCQSKQLCARNNSGSPQQRIRIDGKAQYFVVEEGANRGQAAALAGIGGQWEAVAAGLRRDLGARTFDHWLKALVFRDFCAVSGVVSLTAPSSFAANWINERFADRLLLAWRHLKCFGYPHCHRRRRSEWPRQDR